MSTRLSISESSERITNPNLLAIHTRRESACLELQKDLNEGFYTLSDGVAKIERFTERVGSLGKKYQEEKQKKLLTVAPESIYKQQEEFLQELGTYNETYINTLSLIEKTQSTISYIQPAHRSRSDEKRLQQHTPFYYAELKLSENFFSKYVDQFKQTQSTLSSLNRRLLAAIEGRGLKLSLEKLNKIAEQQATYSSKHRLYNPISPFSIPSNPVILEPEEERPRIPFSSAKRPSTSPLYPSSQPSIKTLAPSLALRGSPLSPEFLCSLSRETQKRRPSISSQEALNQSSPRENLTISWEICRIPSPQPRIEITPARNITFLSPREIPRREAFSRQIQSDGSSSFRERLTSLSSSSPRDRQSRYIRSSEPSTHQVSREPRRILPSWKDRKYEQDTPSPERGRRLYPRKTYETVGATYPYSGSRY